MRDPVTVITPEDTFVSHGRANEAPWRLADDLMKEGKLDEAAAHIAANVDIKGKMPNTSLAYRVFFGLGPRLDAWLAG